MLLSLLISINRILDEINQFCFFQHLQDEIDFKNQEIHEFQAELRIRDQKIADLGNPPDQLFKQQKNRS